MPRWWHQIPICTQCAMLDSDCRSYRSHHFDAAHAREARYGLLRKASQFERWDDLHSALGSLSISFTASWEPAQSLASRAFARRAYTRDVMAFSSVLGFGASRQHEYTSLYRRLAALLAATSWLALVGPAFSTWFDIIYLRFRFLSKIVSDTRSNSQCSHEWISTRCSLLFPRLHRFRGQDDIALLVKINGCGRAYRLFARLWCRHASEVFLAFVLYSGRWPSDRVTGFMPLPVSAQPAFSAAAAGAVLPSFQQKGIYKYLHTSAARHLITINVLLDFSRHFAVVSWWRIYFSLQIAWHYTLQMFTLWRSFHTTALTSQCSLSSVFLSASMMAFSFIEMDLYLLHRCTCKIKCAHHLFIVAFQRYIHRKACLLSAAYRRRRSVFPYSASCSIPISLNDRHHYKSNIAPIDDTIMLCTHWPNL